MKLISQSSSLLEYNVKLRVQKVVLCMLKLCSLSYNTILFLKTDHSAKYNTFISLKTFIKHNKNIYNINI